MPRRRMTLPVLLVMAILPIVEPAMAETPDRHTAAATFGGGCFWCQETLFAELEGVEEAVSGYSGGTLAHPSYRQVCDGETGHAEVVQIRFDPERVSYRDLLLVFFGTHDPTTVDRQGADIGSQYRSIILYHDEDQRAVAEELIAGMEAERIWDHLIETELLPFEVFYAADQQHQDYYSRNPLQPYCQTIIRPKLEKFRREFAAQLKGR